MIITHLSGGLGNQMFQYAAGRALAEHHGVPLTLNIDRVKRDNLRDFELNNFQIQADKIEDMPRSFLKRRIEKHLLGSRYYFEPSFHFDDQFFDLPKDCEIDGVFQSDLYFSPISKLVHSQFQPTDGLSDNSQSYKKQIEDCEVAVSLHIRRGDYLQKEHVKKVHGVLSLEYYKKAIDLMRAKFGDDITVFLFSDDIEGAQADLSLNCNIVPVSGNDTLPHEDMLLMSYCNHNILANSTFSWWGAWLNNYDDKVVIAPRMWFSRETLRTRSTVDLIPVGWIQI